MDKFLTNPSLLSRYEFFNYGHALEILNNAFPDEWQDIQAALSGVKLTVGDISKAGGNESPIPKKFDDILYPLGWREIRISGDLVVQKFPRRSVQRRGKFDRDLLAMRTYFDCGLIDVGIIVTRSEELNDIFRELKDHTGQPLIKKYGASTTWIGKLTYRLDSRRNGGCPILAIGIKKGSVEGYE